MNNLSKKKHLLSIGKQHFFNYILGGFFLCIIAILYLIGDSSFFYPGLIICLVGCGILSIPYFFKKEKDDELSLRILEKAKAMTTTNLCKVLVILVVLFNFLPGSIHKNISTNVNTPFAILYAILGIQNIMTGIYYIKIEKSDEECSF